jgi:hypothetical protein
MLAKCFNLLNTFLDEQGIEGQWKNERRGMKRAHRGSPGTHIVVLPEHRTIDHSLVDTKFKTGTREKP